MADWKFIVEEHSRLVWATAWRLLGNQADAADVCQEAFLAALEFSRREEVRSWPALLQRLATGRAIDRLRVRLRRPPDQASPAEWDAVASPARGPAEEAQAAELGRQLRAAIAALPESQGLAFSLRYLSDLSNMEIAQEIGMTPGAVGVLLHRARAALRDELASTVPYDQGEVRP
jgi:RNA polymerase sigma-70 factor, ECF subfamily